MPRSVDTYVTVDSAGNISFDFTGHISAQGLELIAPTSGVALDLNKIRWHKDTLTGATVAEITATDIASEADLILNALGPTAADAARVDVSAVSNARTTGLTVKQTTAAGVAANLISVQSEAQLAILLNGLGQSGFLKLATLANRRIGFGSASMNFPTSTNSDATVVAHGLTVQPAIVICMALQAPNYNQIPVYSLSSSDATNFTVIGFIPVARTGGISFYWLAIG